VQGPLPGSGKAWVQQGRARPSVLPKPACSPHAGWAQLGSKGVDSVSLKPGQWCGVVPGSHRLMFHTQPWHRVDTLQMLRTELTKGPQHILTLLVFL
jgi:hypothetical protein